MIDVLFLLIVMMAAINLKEVIDGNIKADTSFILSIVGLTVCLAELVCVNLFLYKNFDKLGKD